MTINDCLLLVDLDGILIIGGEQKEDNREVIRLHNNAAELIHEYGESIAILTHRNYSEARLILDTLGINIEKIVGCYAANQITRSAIVNGKFRSLLRHGLYKSYILPHIQRKYGIKPENVAILDDRKENLDDMALNGVGLTMLGPIELLILVVLNPLV